MHIQPRGCKAGVLLCQLEHVYHAVGEAGRTALCILGDAHQVSLDADGGCPQTVEYSQLGRRTTNIMTLMGESRVKVLKLS